MERHAAAVAINEGKIEKAVGQFARTEAEIKEFAK